MRASALWCVSALQTTADPTNRATYLVEAGGETGIEVASSRAEVDLAPRPLRVALAELVLHAEDPLNFDVGIGGADKADKPKLVVSTDEATGVATGAFANPGGRVDLTRGLKQLGLSDLHPEAASLLAAASFVYGERSKDSVPHLVTDKGYGYARGSWDDEWALIQEAQQRAAELLGANGWQLADAVGLGGDDVEKDQNTPGVFYHVYTRPRYSEDPTKPLEPGVQSLEFLVAFRGTEGDADYADNWKNLLPQMIGSALPQGFRKGYIQHVDSGSDLEEETKFSNEFWDFAMQVGESVQGFVRYYDQKLAKHTKISREKIDRNGYLGLLPLVLDDLVKRFGLSHGSQLYVTGHSAGAVRAEAFSDLVKVRLAACPTVVVFSAPGSCAVNEVARSCPAVEVGHGADWYSTAVEGSPEHRTRYAIVLTPEQKKLVHDYCAPLAGHGMGKLVLYDAKRFQACRYLTHDSVSLWVNLIVHPQPLQLDALPMDVTCGTRGYTGSTLRWLFFAIIILVLLLCSIIACCLAAGCTDVLTEVWFEAKQRCVNLPKDDGAAAQ